MESPTKKGHSRSWSFGSKKDDIKLTAAQKKRGKMTKNVDPTRAITEDEPFQVNQSKNHLRSLSQLKFKDRFGNDIVEPDLTNPTRHRWERPLDTIRGFEAAIYKDEHRGSYVERTGSNVGAGYSSDTIDSMDGTWRQPRHQQQPGYYEPSGGSFRRGRQLPDALSYANRSAYSATPRSGTDGYGESELGFGNMNRRSPGPNGYGYSTQPPERMGRPPRRQGYDAPNYDAESPTVGDPNQAYGYTYPTNGGESPPIHPGSSSSGAGSDGPGGYIREPTLPKSNSGQSSFGFRDQAMFESSQNVTPFESFNPTSQQQVSQNVPISPAEATRKPIQLNSSSPAADANPEKEKRKSWFKRRNSKK